MRILFSSHVFQPSVGGLESVSRDLAGAFVRQGHEVQLITQTPASPQEASRDESLPYPVLRKPAAGTLLRLTRWSDVCFHNNISLPRAWPLLLAPRPWVVAHHVWIPRDGAAARAKRFALRFAAGISISDAVAAHLSTPSTVIPNPYDDATFRLLPGIERQRDLVFVGRLVSDKGVDLLLQALATLGSRGLTPTLSIVGAGPEEPALRELTARLGLQSQVSFLGARRGDDLARVLNEHRIAVIPSLWQEPFGIVALETIACGCVAVGSEGGGLRDAIGPCGITFPNGDAEALSGALEQLLRDPARLQSLRQPAELHLRRHRLETIAKRYLAVFTQRLTAGQRLHGSTDAH